MAGRNAHSRVDALDADAIGQLAERGGADAAHAEREAEEHAGDQADASRHELLRVDDDRREGGREDQADHDGEHRGPEEIGVRQQQRERAARRGSSPR